MALLACASIYFLSPLVRFFLIIIIISLPLPLSLFLFLIFYLLYTCKICWGYFKALLRLCGVHVLTPENRGNV